MKVVGLRASAGRAASSADPVMRVANRSFHHDAPIS
jgi:hypothetical protein